MSTNAVTFMGQLKHEVASQMELLTARIGITVISNDPGEDVDVQGERGEQFPRQNNMDKEQD